MTENRITQDQIDALMAVAFDPRGFSLANFNAELGKQYA